MNANDIASVVRPLRDLVYDFINPFDEFVDGLGLGFLTQGSAQPLYASVDILQPLTQAPGLNLIIVPLREVIRALAQLLSN